MPNSNSWEYVSGSFPGYFRMAAALLTDGQTVLVTGGTTDPNHSAGCRQAWKYDGAGLSQLSATMTQPRFGHTATTLDNGHILIAGSEALDTTSNPCAGTAELFDPVAQVFSATGNLMEPRGWHTATYLPSTKEVLIVGGEDPAMVNRGVSSPKKTAELYNYATGTFRTISNAMSVGRSRHTATLLQDGRVLIAGGYGPLASAEIYDPAQQSFTKVGNLSIGRFDHAATLLLDGRVLIAGGYEFGGVSSPCEEIFNPVTNQFSPVPPIQKTAYGLTLSALPNGKVIAVGGSANGEQFFDLTIDATDWLFDPNQPSPTFSPDGPDLERIAFHTATVLANGCVFVIGGISILDKIPKQAMLYWPDLVLLRIRFQGTGKGTVSGVPGSINCSNNADIQVASGLHALLTAQPASSQITTGYRQVPATKISPARWVKCWIFHSFTFDGWGQTAPFATNAQMSVAMTGNKTVFANFTEHTTTSQGGIKF